MRQTPVQARISQPIGQGSTPGKPGRWRASTALAGLLVLFGSEPALATSPEMILSYDIAQSGAQPARALRPRVGEALELKLALPGQRSFQRANIGRFIVRSGDLIETVEIPSGEGSPTYSFSQPGPAVILLSASPEASEASDAWQRVTHCTRVIVNVEPNGPGLPPIIHDPGVNQKAGMPIELLPVLQTHRLRVGDLLPIKGYWHGRSAAGAQITALRPDGTQVTHTSAAWGVADFRMDQAGVWVMQYRRMEAGVEYVAELVFEISRELPR